MNNKILIFTLLIVLSVVLLSRGVDASIVSCDASNPCQGTCGNGVCVAENHCENGKCVCTPGTPLKHTCNGLDNDCDGEIDTGCDTNSCSYTDSCTAVATENQIDSYCETFNVVGADNHNVCSNGAPSFCIDTLNKYTYGVVYFCGASSDRCSSVSNCDKTSYGGYQLCKITTTQDSKPGISCSSGSDCCGPDICVEGTCRASCSLYSGQDCSRANDVNSYTSSLAGTCNGEICDYDAPEVCDGYDNDRDGTVDEGFPGLGQSGDSCTIGSGSNGCCGVCVGTTINNGVCADDCSRFESGYGCSVDNNLFISGSAGTCVGSSCDTSGYVVMNCNAGVDSSCEKGVDPTMSSCNSTTRGFACDHTAGGVFVQDGVCALSLMGNDYDCVHSESVVDSGTYYFSKSRWEHDGGADAVDCASDFTNGNYVKEGTLCDGSCVGTSESNCCNDNDCSNGQTCNNNHVCVTKCYLDKDSDGYGLILPSGWIASGENHTLESMGDLSTDVTSDISIPLISGFEAPQGPSNALTGDNGVCHSCDNDQQCNKPHIPGKCEFVDDCYKCTYLTCNAGWGDCNANLDDGCEVNLNTLNSCGSCGNVCGAMESCVDGVCASIPSYFETPELNCDEGLTNYYSNYSAKTGDCDDDNPAINPDANEYCSDDIDNNCNGLVDCNEDSCGVKCDYCYLDFDGDLVGHDYGFSRTTAVSPLLSPINNLSTCLSKVSADVGACYANLPGAIYTAKDCSVYTVGENAFNYVDSSSDCNDSQSDRWRLSTVYKDADNDGYYDCANPLVNQCVGCDDPSNPKCVGSYMPVVNYVNCTDDYVSNCTFDNPISDCDDGNSLLNHLCCNNENSYEFKKSGATYSYDVSKPNTIFYKVRLDNYDTSWPDGDPRVDSNDWPFGTSDWSLDVYSPDGKTLFDNSIYGCSATPNSAVYKNGPSVVVESSDKYIEFKGVKVVRSTSNCDAYGCPWIDCDNNAASASQCGFPFLLEGKFLKSSWANLSDVGLYNPDDSAVRGFGGYTDYGTNFDVRQTRNESCGDDDMEYATNGSCEASTDYRQLCCVSPDMYNMNGVCLFRDQCPDVMESAPVWIDGLSQAEYDSYVSILNVSGEGYCCNYLPGEDIPIEKNLCHEGEKGCYIKLASLVETPIPKPGYVQNRNNCSAGSCALELCSSATNYSLCEKSTTCNSNVHKLYIPGITNLKECHPSSGKLAIDVKEVASYPSMKAGCDASSCERVNETICTLNTNSNSCYALCNDDNSDCELVCAQSDYSCNDVETLRNCEDDSCVYDNSNPVVSYRYSVNTTQSLSCDNNYFTECNEFGCAPVNYCGGTPPDGTVDYFANCTAYPPLYTHNVVCDEHLFCSVHDCNESQALNSADNLVCLPEVTNALDVDGNNYPKLAMNNNSDTLQCSPDNTIKVKGQPFCPEGFTYVPFKSRCERPPTANCDYGYRGALVTGCDNLTKKNDVYGLYTTGCFKDVNGFQVDSSDDLNSQACCLDYSIVSGSNVYDVYTIKEGEDNIRIY